jgi:hypothetical protein
MELYIAMGGGGITSIGQGGWAHIGRHQQWRPTCPGATYPRRHCRWRLGVGSAALDNGS